MDSDTALRAQLVELLDSHNAHAHFDAAVEGVPEEARGVQPPGLPHSLWQLLEHLRLTQRDILDFCRDPGYTEPKWPDDYWPTTVAPPTPDAWDRSVAAFRADREAMKELARDPATELFAKIPHGQGQTYLREVLLVADHTSYHIGQLVAARQALGVWK